MISILRKLLVASVVSVLTVSTAAAQHVEIDDHDGQSVLRISQNYTLKQGDSVHEAVIIYGDALVELSLIHISEPTRPY